MEDYLTKSESQSKPESKLTPKELMLSYLMVSVIKYTLIGDNFTKLANWLDCNEYMLPAERALDSKLVTELLIASIDITSSTSKPNPITSLAVFKTYTSIASIEVHCSLRVQERILWNLKNPISALIQG